jgi:PAS domain S-box-containing protein
MDENLLTELERLKAENAMLKTAEKIGGSGSYRLSVSDWSITFSDGMFHLFGEKPDSLEPSLAFVDSRSHPDDAAKVRSVIEKAASDGKPYVYRRRIYRADGEMRTLESHGTAIHNENAKTIALIGHVNDITEQLGREEKRRRAEEELRKSEQRFRLFVTTSSDILYKMSADWSELVQIIGNYFPIGKGRFGKEWRNFLPREEEAEVRELVRTAIRKKAPFQREHRVLWEDGTPGWVYSRAVPVLDGDGNILEWFGAATDITWRKEAEEKLRMLNDSLERLVDERTAELKESKELQEAVFRSVRHSITVLEAVRGDDGTITDFRCLLSNGIADRTVGTALTGKNLRGLIPDYFDEANFETMVKTVETGEPAEKVIFYKGRTAMWLHTKYYKLEDKIVVTHENVTKRKEAEQELKENAALLQSVFDTSLIQMSVMKAERDANGDITDFRIMLVNRELERETGRTDLVGKLYTKEYPGIRLSGIFDCMMQVMETGKPARLEYFYPHEGFNKWYSCLFVRNGDGIVATNLDITEKKTAEEERYRNLEMLQGVMDAPNIGLAIYRAIRDESGEIVDFVHELINSRTREALGEDFTGKLLSDHGPDGFGQIDHFKKVIISGKQNTYVRKMQDHVLDGWFLFSNAPLGDDRLVHVWEDVTELKMAEESLRANQEVLQATLDSTLDLVQVFKAVRNEAGVIVDFTWVMTNKHWNDTQPYVIGKSLLTQNPGVLEAGVFDAFVRVVETGVAEKMEHFYDYEQFLGWFKQSIVKMDDGVVLATEDITDRKKSERELLKLKLAQQKEILNAIIAAQEEERLRIGEALHNGVAQLLYAIQTRLQMLETAAGNEEKQHELLTIIREAIDDTRRIAFELVPAILKDFGVEVALKALFQKIVPPELQLALRTRGLADGLPEKFSFAVYRIVQELINNIVKHARASEASVDLKRSKGKVTICVKDNGIGFDPGIVDPSSMGIGLQSIRNRVSLLDGSFAIEKAKRGSEINISLPL